MVSKWILAVITTIGITGSAAANDYNFYLHNRANGWTINGFYTFQNGRWSSNWLKNRISPGNSKPMLWNSDEGNCRVPFRVSWVDWGSQDFTIDWCKDNPTNIYMKDKGFSWD